MVLLDWSLLIFALVTVFVLGAIIGSFLNVCIARLPQEKSLLWPPGSRCGQCFQPVRWFDNIPLVSYWVLRGRCRSCGAAFSVRYFLVELTTALGFVGVFYLVVLANVHHLPANPGVPVGHPLHGLTEAAVIFCIHHAILFCFLLIVSVCDLDRREIPLSVTFTGTAIGVMMAMLLPWPWPGAPIVPRQLVAPQAHWLFGAGIYNMPPLGLWPWPMWWPPPAWLGNGGDWLTGLMTALVGALAGTFLLRMVRFLFTTGIGIEALGLGDADLMMMAGSFLGWQPVVVGFFISPFVALVVTIGQYLWAMIRPTIKIKIVFDDADKPVYLIAGREVRTHQLANVLTREANQTGRSAVWIYGPATMEETVAAVEKAVKQTPIKRVHLTNLLPFGPSLAVGVLVCCLFWRSMAEAVGSVAFQGPMLALFGVVGSVLMLVMAYGLRALRWLRNG